jgi:ribonuclease HI/transposase InsO family protein
VLFVSPLGKHLRYVIRLHFPASNNVAEYEALVNGLRIAIELGVRRLDARGDSQLVIDQVMKNSHCRDQRMEAYCDKVRRLEDKFYGLELNHIARRYNETADEMAKIASGRTTVPPDVFSRDLHQPSVKIDDTLEPEEASAQPEVPSAEPEEASAEPEVPSAIEEEALPVEGGQNGVTLDPNWQTPYLEYLLRGELPLDKAKARRLARRAKSFVLLGDEKELYHRSPSDILKRCISIAQGQEQLQEIHSGACGHHATPRALVGNAFRQGFYWPTVVADATRIVRSCRECQFYAKQTRLPAQALQMIPITSLFAVWGLDLVGPLQKAPGGFSHLLVAIDKFSKWIEVRPLTSIRSEQAVAFFTNIIHRFGVPNSIITDNGTQFTGKKFLDFCEDHHIRVDWAAVAHPMTNGQVERANGMILQGLKSRIYNNLNKFGKRWMKELPSVVWSLRTTPSQATGFSPFFLVYGAEAVLPMDLEYGSPRTRAYNDQSNQTSREDSLDQLEEARDVALLHSARYQQSLRRYHARSVRP